ncbi:hypothetical protein [Candidatus Arsenophonus triatominarum]|uniref:hypothetical protein n=1 Tax=Candidatus Arsenophonus triatominarum TaxID=57911 RepID=UPI0007C46EFC|nr:hypothetical protein [Candidatus Arsenophonus triatominarum]
MGKIIVGCKLPHGLKATVKNETIELKGANACAIYGGFGITEGVDEAWFNVFSKTYAQAGFIKKGLIFKVTDQKSFSSAAKERAQVKTGLEPINPKKATVKPTEVE